MCKNNLETSHVDDVMILQVQDAILDYTRVIHMRPDISDYHMARVSAHLYGGVGKKHLLSILREVVSSPIQQWSWCDPSATHA